MNVAAVLLDLDGTLVDSAPDLVAVLNRVLVERGRPRMPYAIARNEVSNGALGLLRLGFGAEPPAPGIEGLRQRFLEVYAENVCVNSRLFISIETISEVFHDIPWGVVTNKPQQLTMPLLERLGIGALARCVVSGDRLPQRKPHPAPLRLAAEELDVPAEQCVYVGDAFRDIEAGKAAGMATIAAAYGYIRPAEDLGAWHADRVISRPGELGVALANLRAGAAS